MLPARLRRNFRPHPAVQSSLQMSQQMEAVRAVRFEPVSILKREEARLLPALEDAAERLGRGHRVLVQMSLAEMIRPRKARAACPNVARPPPPHRRPAPRFRRGGPDPAALSSPWSTTGPGATLPEAFARQTLTREAVERAGVAFLESRKVSTTTKSSAASMASSRTQAAPPSRRRAGPVKLAQA